MTQEFPRYEPNVPIETTLFLGVEAKTWDWYPYPSRTFWEPVTDEVADLDTSDEIISLVLENGLGGDLDAIDLTVGCQHPCQTCIRDSQHLSATTSLDSIIKLTESDVLQELLPEVRTCVGYTSEPTDNEHIVEIMQLILSATADKQSGFSLVLRTNYRSQKRDVLIQLMELANNDARMHLLVSLPLNRNRTIQESFYRFKQENQGLFSNKVEVFDLRDPKWREVENLGRTLPGAEESKMAKLEQFQVRGKGGFLINPEGLWFMINATSYDAHTPEIFTPVTHNNVGIITSNLKRLNSNFVDFGEATNNMERHEQSGLRVFSPRIG